jgi:UDP-glucuronate 4-epimerase
MYKKNILITGVAGFIGFSLAKKILSEDKNINVYGIDNLNDYYSVKLKKKRLNILFNFNNFFFSRIDIVDKKKLKIFLNNKNFDLIFHFAAQAGVRYTAEEPAQYFYSNIIGFFNILEILTKQKMKPKKIFYASSSSVYGEQKNIPYKENVKIVPKNIYAVTKRINEYLVNFYIKRLNIKFIGLRLFTVYGEWGRPDMFLMKLFKSFFSKKNFYLNNNGKHLRDFTYIGDVLFILKKLINTKMNSKHLILNICRSEPISINKVINFFQEKIGNVKLINIKKNNLEILNTYGDNNLIKKYVKNIKFTNFFEGMMKTFNWYKKNKIYKIT